MLYFAPVICLLTLGAAACTTELADNGDPREGRGVMLLSDVGSLHQVGDGFTLETRSLLQRVEWWGAGEVSDWNLIESWDEFAPHFSVRIFAAGDSVPMYEVDLGTVDGAPEKFHGGEHQLYSAPLPPVALLPGDYLLSIVDLSEYGQWFWSVSCKAACDGQSFRRATDEDAWEVGDFGMAFRLIGANATEVPICHCEPGEPAQCRTLAVGIGAGFSHIDHHPYDSFGACER